MCCGERAPWLNHLSYVGIYKQILSHRILSHKSTHANACAHANACTPAHTRYQALLRAHAAHPFETTYLVSIKTHFIPDTEIQLAWSPLEICMLLLFLSFPFVLSFLLSFFLSFFLFFFSFFFSFFFFFVFVLFWFAESSTPGRSLKFDSGLFWIFFNS